MVGQIQYSAKNAIQNESPKTVKPVQSSINDVYAKNKPVDIENDMILESWEDEDSLSTGSNSILSHIIMFKCDKSKRMRTVFASDSKKHATKILCDCGVIHRILMDSRYYDRHTTKLSGFYLDLEDDNKFGKMILEDLSLGGAKFRVESLRELAYGDVLLIQFILDNDEKTFIQEKVRVRHADDSIIGTEFVNPDKLNKNLIIHLMK